MTPMVSLGRYSLGGELVTLIELEHKLSVSNIPKDAYSLSGGLPNEAHCIESVDGRWQVYYSERGIRTGVRRFDTEREACDDLLDRVTR
jgi:hypothetical protein